VDSSALAISFSHFVRLPQRQHAAREQRRHLVGRVFVALRLAQLNLGAGRITGLKQRLAQQKTRFGQIRFLLQSVLQLDGGRLGFVLGEVLLGRCEHGFWLLASTADQEQSGQQTGDGHFAQPLH
jgi:hypothetical protein